jgi:hypothetical protein
VAVFDPVLFVFLNRPRNRVCVRPSHLPSPAKPRHGVHLNLSGHQF